MSSLAPGAPVTGVSLPAKLVPAIVGKSWNTPAAPVLPRVFAFTFEIVTAPEMDTNSNRIVAVVAKVVGSSHLRSYQLAAVTGQLKVLLPAPVDPIFTPAVATAVMFAARTKWVSSRMGVVVLTTPPVKVCAAVKLSVAPRAAEHPTFAALFHWIGQWPVESMLNPLVPDAMLAGSVPSVPNKYHPDPGVVTVGGVPVLTADPLITPVILTLATFVCP